MACDRFYRYNLLLLLKAFTTMQLVRCLQDLKKIQSGSIVTIGNFDGLHLGHQVILEHVKVQAKKLSVPSVVIIFEPQPKEFFVPDAATIRLTRLREKLELFRDNTIDFVLCLHFNQSFSKLTAEDFIKKILVDALHVKHIEVGDDFVFGAQRVGSFAMLEEAGKQFGFSVKDAKTVFLDGERISSTRVRNALLADDLDLVERLLGRPFQLSGRVIHGQQLARKLGCPTANIQLKRKQAPLKGVFVVSCELDGKVYCGVANIGIRPTVKGDGKPHLEVHLLDFSGDLYKRHIRVTFHQKLRDEKKFNSLDELKAAIDNDVTNARAYWHARGLLKR